MKTQTFKQFERPFDWDTFSTKERLDNIVDRLVYITNQERYREMRSRWTTSDQYDNEFGEDYQKYMSGLWLTCKYDYSERKNEYDSWLTNSGHEKSEFYKSCIKAMNQVIEDEIETILLEGDQE